MAKKHNIWVTHRSDDNWEVKSEGANKPYRVVDTQREANQIAREVAINHGVERITQGEEGRIVSKDSFGKDNHRIKDKEH